MNNSTKEPYLILNNKYNRIEEILWLTFSPLIIVGGLIGNILTIVVLRTKYFNKIVVTRALLLLAICDSIVLLLGPTRFYLNWSLTTRDKYDIRTSAQLICKLHIFFECWMTQCTAWIIVFVSVMRLMSVTWPPKTKVWLTKFNTRLVLGVLIVLLFALNFHLFFTLSLEFKVDRDIYTCQFSSKRIQVVFDVQDAIQMSLVPFCIVLVMNALILCILARARRQKSIRTTGGSDQFSSISSMLFAVCFVFLLTTGPLIITQLVWYTITPKPSSDFSSLVFGCLNLLFYCNHVLNFYLYTLSGSQFRQTLVSVLLGKDRKRHEGSRNPSLTTASLRLVNNHTRKSDELLHLA